MFYRRNKLNKRGQNILLGTIVTIILNVVFISLMVLFLSSRMNDMSAFEESYSKQIALVLDAALPGMALEINMSEPLEKIQDEINEGKLSEIVNIENNQVTVKFSLESKGYSYYFFNDLKILDSYLDVSRKTYVILIGGYNE